MDVNERLRELPAVDEVLRRAAVQGLVQRHGRVVVRDAVRSLIEARRRALLALPPGTEPAEAAKPDAGAELDAAEIARALERRAVPSLRAVVNATGVVLHTNLGRAPLAERALERVRAVAGSYSTLEWEADSGARGRREAHVRALLRVLTGAEDALVVNNNAAAVLLALRALASGREVVVSRGELVEIGGGFRIPDVMAASGARLREVGTTNRTHLADYERAVGVDTALIMRVHRSNFALVGFTATVSRAALVELGREKGVDVIEDLGSGCLVDLGRVGGGEAEPTVQQAVAAGVDLVTFSGDKLLGGPQAGIVVGREDMVARLRRDPLMRAVRPDKMTLAALQATLELYQEGLAEEAVPALRALRATSGALRADAEALAAALSAAAPSLRAEVVAVADAVGGGAYPSARLAGFAVALDGAGLAPAEDARTADGEEEGTAAQAEGSGERGGANAVEAEGGEAESDGETEGEVDAEGEAARREREAGAAAAAEEVGVGDEPAAQRGGAGGQVSVAGRRGDTAEALAAALRGQRPPIVARIGEGRVLLDVRTLLPGDAAVIVAACRALAANGAAGRDLAGAGPFPGVDRPAPTAEIAPPAPPSAPAPERGAR
ncbi:MAG TPA: L-seryl-tRNA(Sec) selenium transferase [Myxococcota bacterium]|jgi:L-seryl-tRNA(Ser) seleniumtransferase|nr:L-seryl-tRNA(Sec) selenium transferase [Myxococcota bacterium]